MNQPVDDPNKTWNCFSRFLEASSGILLIELDAEGRIVRTNPAARRVLQRLGDPEDKPFAQFVLGLDSAHVADLAERFSARRDSAGELVELGADAGVAMPYRFKAEHAGNRLLLFGEASTDETLATRRELERIRNHFAAAVRMQGRLALDRTRLQEGLEEAGRQLERVSHSDPLTGLANRREFLRLLRAEWARFRRYGRPYTICIAEVCGLAVLAAREWTAAADAALAMTAELIRGGLRDSDISARFSDCRFGCIFTETTVKTGVEVAQRLHAAVARRTVALPAGGYLRLALGISQATPEDEHAEHVLRRAVQAADWAIASEDGVVRWNERPRSASGEK